MFGVALGEFTFRYTARLFAEVSGAGGSKRAKVPLIDGLGTLGAVLRGLSPEEIRLFVHVPDSKTLPFPAMIVGPDETEAGPDLGEEVGETQGVPPP